MKIKEKFGDLTAATAYAMTRGHMEKMRSAVGSVINFDMWVLYEDINKDGNPVTVLSILDKNTGCVFATNSATFIREFLAARDVFAEYGETFNKLSVITGSSKGGREYITCTVI